MDSRRRAAFLLASLSIVLCVVGTGRAVAVMRRNAASGADIARLFSWTWLPLGLAIAGAASALARLIGAIWLCAGALCGFVVFGAWSLGPFYASGALALLAAALVHLTSIRPRWRILLSPLWFLAGVSTLPTVLLLVEWSRQNANHHITEAPAVVAGGWLFAIVCGMLAAAYGVAWSVQRPGRNQRSGRVTNG